MFGHEHIDFRSRWLSTSCAAEKLGWWPESRSHDRCSTGSCRQPAPYSDTGRGSERVNQDLPRDANPQSHTQTDPSGHSLKKELFLPGPRRCRAWPRGEEFTQNPQFHTLHPLPPGHSLTRAFPACAWARGLQMVLHNKLLSLRGHHVYCQSHLE